MCTLAATINRFSILCHLLLSEKTRQPTSSNLQATSNTVLHTVNCLLLKFHSVLLAYPTCIFSFLFWEVGVSRPTNDCLEILLSEITYYVLGGTKNTHSLAHTQLSFCANVCCIFTKKESTTCDIGYAGALPPPTCTAGNILLMYILLILTFEVF